MRTGFLKKIHAMTSDMPLTCQITVCGFIRGMSLAAGNPDNGRFQHPLFELSFAMGKEAWSNIMKFDIHGHPRVEPGATTQ